MPAICPFGDSVWVWTNGILTSPAGQEPSFSTFRREYLGIGTSSASRQEYGCPMLGTIFQHIMGGSAYKINRNGRKAMQTAHKTLTYPMLLPRGGVELFAPFATLPWKIVSHHGLGAERWRALQTPATQAQISSPINSPNLPLPVVQRHDRGLNIRGFWQGRHLRSHTLLLVEVWRLDRGHLWAPAQENPKIPPPAKHDQHLPESRVVGGSVEVSSQRGAVLFVCHGRDWFQATIRMTYGSDRHALIGVLGIAGWKAHQQILQFIVREKWGTWYEKNALSCWFSCQRGCGRGWVSLAACAACWWSKRCRKPRGAAAWSRWGRQWWSPRGRRRFSWLQLIHEQFSTMRGEFNGKVAPFMECKSGAKVDKIHLHSNTIR